MSEILGFLISFGLIAAFISALTSGPLRNIAFGLLIIFAIIVGQERLGTQLSSFSFPFASGAAPSGTSAPAAASYGVGGPTYSTTRPQNYGGTYPSRNNPDNSYTTSINPNPDSRGVYYPNDPYYNDPYYGGSYPDGFYSAPGSGQQTQTGRGVRALW